MISPRNVGRARWRPAFLALSLFGVRAATFLDVIDAQRPAAQPPRAVSLDARTAAQLRYRYIGPVGNRVSSVAGVPGDPNTYYAGAASGGVWKTTDGGVHWTPVFDDKPVHSIGALAVAPSNANVVWAGTGEPFIRSHISVGWGVYKSTNAGRTWTLMGLEATGRIGRIVIDPTNPDIVFVAAQGHSYGPQPERGIYRTMDGGRTWERVLFVDENTGGIDVVMHPTNARILFAATWQLEMHTWGRESGGPGSGIYVSRDGGATWSRLTGNGLPRYDVGKIGLAISRSNPDRVYALIETGDGVPNKGKPTDNGELWRSEDGGATWKVVSYDRNLACRQPYYTRMAVAPDNPDETYFLCATFSRSLDGGVTNSGAGGGGGGRGAAAAAAAAAGRGAAGRGAAPPADSATMRDLPLATPGGDNHDMWIDPTNPSRMAVANDAGVSISTTRARTWMRVQLPIAQMYHVTVDNRVPYYVYGNKQDGPSYRGPSNSRSGAQIARSEWHGVLGGESGFATPDPVDTNVIWSTASGSGSRGGIVVRFDQRNRDGRDVEIWPMSTGGTPAADVRYRFVWDFPLAISPHDHNKIYAGSQHVHVTTNGGRSWSVISPDLTRNDKTKQQISGGLTPDNIGVEYGGTLMAIAESRAQAGVIWTGSNDGVVQVTRNGGTTWTNVTANLPGAPTWGSIRHIEPSRYAAGSAYLIVDGHQENSRDPWVYRTNDFGRSWKLIVDGIPKSPLSYAHIIREDPVRRGLLYLGTENALYASFDDGDHWQSMQSNLPPSPVYGLAIQEHFNDLVIGTYGRGFWILDDLSPLQNLTPEVMASAAHLFAPRVAYRFQDIPGNFSVTDDPTAGQNPPYGAAINYWLASPAGAVSLAIRDAAGKTIRTITGTRHAGLNRVYWDLRNESSRPPRLRTKPLYNAEFQMDSDGTRAAAGFGGGIAVLMPPGRYTVELTVDGRTSQQPLEARKDPNTIGTLADIRAQADALLALQSDHSAAAEMLGTVDNVRMQALALGAQLAGDAGAAALRAATDSLEQRFLALASKIADPRLTGRGQDEVRYPVRVAGQISYVAGGIGASDFAPTTQQREVADVLAKQVRDIRSELDKLVRDDLAKLNAQLRARGLKTIEMGVRGVAVF